MSAVRRVKDVPDLVVPVSRAYVAHRQFADEHALALHLHAEIDPAAFTRQLDVAATSEVFLRRIAVERSEVEVPDHVGIGEQGVVTFEVIGRQRADDESVSRERIDELHHCPSVAVGSMRSAASSTTNVKKRFAFRTVPLKWPK